MSSSSRRANRRRGDATSDSLPPPPGSSDPVVPPSSESSRRGIVAGSQSPLAMPPPSSSSVRGPTSSSPQAVDPTTSPRRVGTSSEGRRALRLPQTHVMSDDSGAGGEQILIWGTNLNLAETDMRCKNFFSLYSEEPAGAAKYMEMARALLDEGIGSARAVFNIDMHDVFAYDPSLYHDFVQYPIELSQIMDQAVATLIEQECEARGEPDVPSVECRVFNLREVKGLRDLDPTHIDTLVSIRGMIIRASSIIPDLQAAVFRCANCQATEEVQLERGRINEPSACANCKTANMMEVIHNRGQFKDKQLVRLQEAPGSVPDGETPQTVTLTAHDDLVDAIRLGDRIEVTGVFRAVPLRFRPGVRTLKSIFKTYIDVVHYRLYKGKLLVDSQNEGERAGDWIQDVEQMSKDQQLALDEKMREIATRPNVYEVLLRSFAPGIHEQDDVKMGVLAQLFGGSNVMNTDAPNGRFRGEINILLVGDPGVAKSQLLQYVHKIAPRGIYTSGKGSSSVGLTAYVAKDPETRELVLESGALVLSDQGICCIDEFDKMSDSTRSVLHEVMEQQTISIAKAGIVCSLNARTSILAAANPLQSRYNPTMSVVENLSLPPSLLSRFDLIYLLLDKPNPYNDRRLAKHIVSLFFENPPQDAVDDDLLDVHTMTQYIAFCRSQPPPALSDGAAEELCSGYVKMRNSGASRNTITATPRQLESVIRLAEARAKMRLSPEVTVDDVREGIRLMKVATQSAATDPLTGVIDMEIISTGRSAASRMKIRNLAEKIANLMAERTEPTIRMGQLLEVLNEGDRQGQQMVTLREAREAMELLVVDERALRTRGEGRDETFQRTTAVTR